MGDDANVANLTSIRGKDWIFNAIWAACGEANAPKYTILLLTCRIPQVIDQLIVLISTFRHTDASSISL